jgi:uncharacterized protein (DUF927 family)
MTDNMGTLVVLPETTRVQLETALPTFKEEHGLDAFFACLGRHGVSRQDLPAVHGKPIPHAVFQGFTALAAELQGSGFGNPDWPFRLVSNGVEKLVEYTKGRERYSEWRWVCSPLEVVAETRNSDGVNWGRLLRITDRDGRVKEWAMPMSLLAGEGREYRDQLLSLGVVIAPGRNKELHEYISTARPTQKVRCVERVGWHGRLYVGPDETWGATVERYVLQRTSALENVYRQRGDLGGWQRDVARYAIGNSRLALALCAAFAAPLLHPTNSESGGFHFRGGSSTGKTTALRVAGSVCGGNDFIRTWRATSNGLEGVAVLHCDGLLCLDELGQVDARQAGETAYMLANGQGKVRAGQSGAARDTAKWRVVFVSSGEISLADKIAEEGSGRRVAAGQAVRVLDIPADAGAGLGIFENLHGFPAADRFARHLTQAVSEHHGIALRAFLQELAKDFDAIEPTVERYRDEFIADNVPVGADGQVRRAAERFGLVAAAGEMAASFGVLPWGPGEAIWAVARCFRDWLGARGGSAAAEDIAAVDRVREFIAAHGSSRFGSIRERAPHDLDEDSTEEKIINRVGFRRRMNDGSVHYLVFPALWQSEICAGMDAKRVADTLLAKGFLITDGEGKRQVKCRVPTSDKPIRMYVIKSIILGEDSPAEHADFDVIEF